MIEYGGLQHDADGEDAGCGARCFRPHRGAAAEPERRRCSPPAEEALLPSLSGGVHHAAAPAEEALLPRLSGGVGHATAAAAEEEAPGAAAVAGSMPRWVKARLRRLLRNKKVDAVVSKDGHPGEW